jgi:HPt (histidine-containing phosphotransfer) domain-containing protein
MPDIKYSLDYLNSISGGDTDFVKEMIQTFLSNVPEELLKIQHLIEKKEWKMVGSEAHRFASNLVFLELNTLRDITVKIEEMGTNQKHTDQISDLFNQLKAGCDQIIQKLKNDFSF